MFIDRVRITVKSGDGGHGARAFRREKYVPEGGPAGGDGGRGGNVYLVADANAHTLMDYRYKKNYRAEDGMKGGQQNRHGKAGEDLMLRVPPGTVVFDQETNVVLADLSQLGELVLLFAGGRGGRGNARFATSVHQAPTYAEKGEPGQEREIRLELKSIADVGLVGFPNAGKSTLLSVVSKARPKVADYPFTTLEPHLGVVAVGEKSFVMADIPGLIEGAHVGQGLGHEFLRHIERTRVLIHVVDAAGTEGRDPVADIATINRELASYSPLLAERPQVVALNKIDAMEDEELQILIAKVEVLGLQVFPISAVIGEGVMPLLYRVMELVEAAPVPSIHEVGQLPELVTAVPLSVSEQDGVFVVQGTEVERLIARCDLDDDDSVMRLQRSLKQLKVFELLRQSGITEGAPVRIGQAEFNFYDDEPI
ncbi:MAG: GTPase Obg [Firmicutes bacterium]|nr:GTPase Obg [Bacillota bacterium]